MYQYSDSDWQFSGSVTICENVNVQWNIPLSFPKQNSKNQFNFSLEFLLFVSYFWFKQIQLLHFTPISFLIQWKNIVFVFCSFLYFIRLLWTSLFMIAYDCRTCWKAAKQTKQRTTYELFEFQYEAKTNGTWKWNTRHWMMIESNVMRYALCVIVIATNWILQMK